MLRIVVIQSEDEIQECAVLLAKSFATVAKQYGLTEDNAPTNPAFMTAQRLSEYLRKPVMLFGMLEDNRLVGCVALERAKTEPDTFYVERLAVDPTQRHQGYGETLMSFATETIRRVGGRQASIGVMNQNKVLKDWYQRQGFVEIERKHFEHLPFEVCFMSKGLGA